MHAIGPNNGKPSDEPRLSRKEFGDLFHVSPETVKRRTREKLLNPEHVNSRVILYTPDDIQAMATKGYPLDFERAREFGIRPEDVGCTSVRRSPLGKETIVGLQPSDDSKACVPQLVNSADQPHDFESEVFLAKLRWSLRQPEIREMLIPIIEEAIGDDDAA
jgi:hypothetical protein